MCEISKKTKSRLKLLVGILTFTPFAYAANLMRMSPNPVGWWICLIIGIVMGIWMPSQRMEDNHANYDRDTLQR